MPLFHPVRPMRAAFAADVAPALLAFDAFCILVLSAFLLRIAAIRMPLRG